MFLSIISASNGHIECMFDSEAIAGTRSKSMSSTCVTNFVL